MGNDKSGWVYVIRQLLEKWSNNYIFRLKCLKNTSKKKEAFTYVFRLPITIYVHLPKVGGYLHF